MKIKYYFLVLTLVSMIVFSLSACGNSQAENTNTASGANTNGNMDASSESDVSDSAVLNEFTNGTDSNSEMFLEIDNKLSLIESEVLQYPGKENGYVFNAYESYAEITHCPRGDTSLEIPSTLGGLPVWVIGEEAARRNKTLESVIIPDTVVKIGEYAFYEAENLKSVEMPNSVAIIEEAAFYGTEVPEVPIPENIRVIEDQAFPQQYWKHSIIIPESAESIGFQVFCFDNLQDGDTVTITILSRDVELSDEFYFNINWDSDGNTKSVKTIIRGYAGSTAAAYCADHNKTMEVISE